MSICWLIILTIHSVCAAPPTTLWWLLLIPMFIQDTWDLAEGGIWSKLQKVSRSKDFDYAKKLTVLTACVMKNDLNE